MMRKLLVFVFVLSTLVVPSASAVCMNKFTVRSDGPKQFVTILTGKLTFQDAQARAAAIRSGKMPPFEWVSEEGKVVSKQFGDLTVVRPMPVGCDSNTSGVVIVVMFPAARAPSKKMDLKVDPNTTIELEEQK